jgi:hypothetical protein
MPFERFRVVERAQQNLRFITLRVHEATILKRLGDAFYRSSEFQLRENCVDVAAAPTGIGSISRRTR